MTHSFPTRRSSDLRPDGDAAGPPRQFDPLLRGDPAGGRRRVNGRLSGSPERRATVGSTRVATLRRAGRWMPGPAGKRGQAFDNAAFTPQGRPVAHYRRLPIPAQTRNLRTSPLLAHLYNSKPTPPDPLPSLLAAPP